MTDMGRYFETPKNSNRRLWVLLQGLAEAGYCFNTGSSGGRLACSLKARGMHKWRVDGILIWIMAPWIVLYGV
jgi:hypothetical protein